MIPEDVELIARTLNMKLHRATELGQRTQWIAEAILTDREARSGWRDIASLTPEDGMIVVGYGEYRERDGFSPAFMRWHAVLNGWTVTGMPFYPTHWMPIPVAPSSSPYPSREETEGEAEELDWKNGEARSPLGDLYEACQLSPLVWVARKNGTEIATWVSSESLARGVAQADFDRLKKASTAANKGKSYHVVFDKFPDHDAPRYIELENDNGRSISAGEWNKRDDGLVELVLPAETHPKPDISALLLEAEKAQAERDDKIEGLSADLFEAVKIAYRRGAVVWVSENYPQWLQNIQESGIGDEEVWRRLEGFSKSYQVSSRGRVRNETGRLLKTPIDTHGYRRVPLRTIEGKRILPLVASIVAQAFIGPRPEGMQVAHLDGDKTHDFANNLAYVTATENTAHKLVHGTYSVGDNHPGAKITSSIARAIYLDPRTAPAVSKDYGIDKSVVRRIRRGETWSAATHDLRAARSTLSKIRGGE